MKEEIITTDFSKFGYYEREIAETLLRTSREQGFPEEFYDNEITIAFNRQSGCVFFTNSDYQVAMMNNNKLEMFYNCPICGYEGFAENMMHNEDELECQEWLKDIGII